jgi:hypothetical protein
MNNRLLYVTSFSDDLYKASGYRLINTYIKHKILSPMLVCYENFDYVSPEASKIFTYPLHTSDYLNNWLIENNDIIPEYLGGTATAKTSPDIFSKVMKRKASRFFRKVAALEYALETYGETYQYIVWIDCDCHFIKHLSNNDMISKFRDRGMFYHQGKSRESIDAGYEAGIMGFSKNYGGYELLDRVIECFADGSFRQYRRWDDGYVIRKIVQESPDIPTIDLTPDCPNNNPILTRSPFNSYIRHEKGKHGRMNISL